MKSQMSQKLKKRNNRSSQYEDWCYPNSDMQNNTTQWISKVTFRKLTNTKYAEFDFRMKNSAEKLLIEESETEKIKQISQT